MVATQAKLKHKKTSRGERTHVRRMKQEARKGPILDNRINKKSRKTEAASVVSPTVEK